MLLGAAEHGQHTGTCIHAQVSPSKHKLVVETRPYLTRPYLTRPYRSLFISFPLPSFRLPIPSLVLAAAMATQAVSASTLPLSRVAPGAASRTAAPRSLASAASPALCGLRAVTHGAPGSRPCLRRLAPAPRASAEEEAPKTEATPKPAEATPTGQPPCCLPIFQTAAYQYHRLLPTSTTASCPGSQPAA